VKPAIAVRPTGKGRAAGRAQSTDSVTAGLAIDFE
jgi:hypothetical protein